MLERRVRSIRRFRGVALAVVVAIGLAAARSLAAPHLTAHAALALVVGSTWLRTVLVTYPRLLRELHELRREGVRS